MGDHPAWAAKWKSSARYWLLRFLFALTVIETGMQGNTIWGESPPAFLPKLTTARAVHQLTPDEAARGYPVRLRGVVTYYDPY